MDPRRELLILLQFRALQLGWDEIAFWWNQHDPFWYSRPGPTAPPPAVLQPSATRVT